MEGMVILNQKEQKRVMVLNRVGNGEMSIRQAAEVLDLSLRHTKRLKAAYREEGAKALAHGNRGRKPAHTIKDCLSKQVLELASV